MIVSLGRAATRIVVITNNLSAPEQQKKEEPAWTLPMPPKPNTSPTGQLPTDRAGLNTSLISDISQDIQHPGFFKDILVDEKEIPLHTKTPCKVKFADADEGVYHHSLRVQYLVW